VKGAHVVNTDVWASMGQEEEQAERVRAFKGYMVDDRLMQAADRKAIFLHCLPAHRGEEVSEEVFEGDQSRVWDQAENRLHVQKALMAMLMGETSKSVSGTRKSVSGKKKSVSGKSTQRRR
jgi:ornithine carbamoyltransferase